MIQLMIVENHRPYLGAIRRLLDAETDIQIVYVAFSTTQALAHLEKHLVDIVLTDLFLGPEDDSGIELAEAIHAAYPSVETLLITSHPKGEIVSKAMKTEIGGMLDKHSSEHDLITAIRTINQGGTYFSPSMKKMVQKFEKRQVKAVKHFQLLTCSESQTLSLIAQGLSILQIAHLISRRPSYIEVLRRNLMKKFQVQTNAALVNTAQQFGYLSHLLQG